MRELLEQYDESIAHLREALSMMCHLRNAQEEDPGASDSGSCEDDNHTAEPRRTYTTIQVHS